MSVFAPEPYRMSANEAAAGWVPGIVTSSTSLLAPAGGGVASARRALEDVLRPALHASPCVISFSGGRDSSALLAVATGLARREGLPEPVPLTYRYPGVRTADESAWQEMVVRHLRVTEWERLELTDDADLLGARGRESLQRHGLLWPPTIHIKGPQFAPAAGGAIITGEGGDVLGGLRLQPWIDVRKRQSPVNRSTLGELARAAPLPARARRPLLRRRHAWLAMGRRWLRPAVREWMTAAEVEDDLRRPLSPVRDVEWSLRRRASQAAMGNLQVIGDEHRVRCVHPFFDPAFVQALSGIAPAWRWPSRTQLMALLFGDVLPRPMIHRATKAFFNHALFGPTTRAFVADWDGEGLDRELVDVDALRADWGSSLPHGGSLQLVQGAWLSADGGPTHPVMSPEGGRAAT